MIMWLLLKGECKLLHTVFYWKPKDCRVSNTIYTQPTTWSHPKTLPTSSAIFPLQLRFPSTQKSKNFNLTQQQPTPLMQQRNATNYLQHHAAASTHTRSPFYVLSLHICSISLTIQWKKYISATMTIISIMIRIIDLEQNISSQETLYYNISHF